MRNSLPETPGLHGSDDPVSVWSGMDRDPRVGMTFAVPVAAAVTLVVAATMSALPGHGGPWTALAVMAAVVSLSGWFSTWEAAAATAVVAWLMLNGFVEDRYGVLRWHGRADAIRLSVLVAAAATVAALREAQILRRRRAVEKRMSVELAEMAEPSHETSRKHLD